MGMISTWRFALLLSSVAVFGHAAPASADDSDAAMKAHAAQDEAERAARWKDLRHEIFGARFLGDGAGVIQIAAPEHALDAALVPVTLTMKAAQPIKGVYLVIDN